MDTSFGSAPAENAIARNAKARKTILLLSGTSEGPTLAGALAQAGMRVLATVTRLEACEHLFAETPENVTVAARGFTAETLAACLVGGEADLVLDATHPFAVRITRIAHDVCTRLHMPYVRFERPDWTPPPEANLVDSFAEAAARLPDLGKRVMLTIGAKQLKHFAHLHDRLALFARILPSPLSLEQALKAGFSGANLVCLRPPFSLELNKALFRKYQVDVLVTKASGVEGGVVEKVTAARELGMRVVVIRRPALPEISAVRTLAEAVARCLDLIHGLN